VHQLGENDREGEHGCGDGRCGNALCNPSAAREAVDEGEEEVPVGKGYVHDEGEGREDRREEDGVGYEARARGFSSVVLLGWVRNNVFLFLLRVLKKRLS
jgi:hypothetical protein